VAQIHHLLPETFSDILLSDELLEYVQELHRIGVPPLKIQMVLEARGVRVSSAQIHHICKPSHLEAFGDSSAALVSLIRDVHGNLAEYEESFHQSRVQVTVFTQIPENNAILAEFGDVVEIDGTHGPLKTNWEIILITVLDHGRHVHCGGIVFAAYVTTDVIHWLLKVLFESCPGLAHLRKALISDEDSAFIPVVELFMQSTELREGFAHILCSMHKERLFVKKPNRCGLARKEHERAASLFRQVAYSDHRS
jgi:hypothetical protein